MLFQILLYFSRLVTINDRFKAPLSRSPTSGLAAEVREVGLLFFEFLGLWEIDRFNRYHSLSAIDFMEALQSNDLEMFNLPM
jgi:hypothetical protein